MANTDLDRATRTAWIGCTVLGVIFVGMGVFSGIAGAVTTDESMRTPDFLMAVIGVVFGAITIVGALRLRQRDARGVRFASIILRFVFVVAFGNMLFSVANGLGENLSRFFITLAVVVVTGLLWAALERLRTALTTDRPAR